jgi:hypothetical protein
VRLLLVALLLSCTDPRARPVPPTVELAFAPGTVVTSPDTLRGTLYAFAADGLAEVRVMLKSSDSNLQLDSSYNADDPFELNRFLTYAIPPGLAVGTTLQVTGRAEDFVGFFAVDTVTFTITDTTTTTVELRSARTPSLARPNPRNPL